MDRPKLDIQFRCFLSHRPYPVQCNFGRALVTRSNTEYQGTMDDRRNRPSGRPLGRCAGLMRVLPRHRPKAGLAGDERGASAVEFAFVLPILLLLLTGMIDVGVLMLTQNNMIRVAQSAARNLALAQMDEAQTETYIHSKLANLGTSLKVEATLPDTEAVPPETDVTVSLSIPMADVIPIDIVGMGNLKAFRKGALQTQVTMRQEVPQ